MNESTNIPAPVEYKDRRAGLIVMGSLEIVLGVLSAVMVPVIILIATIDPQLSGGQNRQIIGATLTVYGSLAVALVWLGTGSILCRRWARALLLILSWSWLIAGIFSVIVFLVFARTQVAGAVGDSAAKLVMAFTEIFQAIFMVAVPGAMVLFYKSRHVKATCEARDPVARWTDFCPLPVLATSLWLGIGAISLLAAPLWSRSLVPLFGFLITGTQGTLILLVCAAAWFYLAWATYRLRIAGWWMTLLVFALSFASVLTTLFKVDLVEIYRQMGYSEQVIEQMRRLSFLTGKIMAWWTLLLFVLFLVYLVWIKKYFQKESGSAPRDAAA